MSDPTTIAGTPAAAAGDGSAEAAEAPSTHMLDLRTPARHVEPEAFQDEIITGIAGRLRVSETPVLLRAPTGAGKTLMLARALQATAQETRTLWFWFAPYTHLVGQTITAINSTCPRLHAYSLADERHADHGPGDVLVANVQVVAASQTQLRRINLDDDETVSLATLIDRARGRGYRIGIVVDEAHLGLSSETVFGRLVRRIAPDRLLMATATPRDRKLAAFVDAAGYSQYATFTASRIDAVNAGLNKRYVLAHVYRPRSSLASVADVRGTVLLRAWGRHQRVKAALQRAGIATPPLLLVQVENGPGTVEAAHRALVHTCGVPHGLIGQHTQETPDPLTLANIANDPSREVLIFKEAAGTGFDAPRAFVLASMKHVVDEGFATQFLGRIMRVDRGVRVLLKALEREGARLPVELDTGYLYLANQEAQTGFQQAVGTMQRVESELAGALEAIRPVQHRNGSTSFTNIPESQEALVLRERPLPGEEDGEGEGDDAETLARLEEEAREREDAVARVRASLFPVDPDDGAAGRTWDDDIFGGVAAPEPVYTLGSLFEDLGPADAVPAGAAPAARTRRAAPGVPGAGLADEDEVLEGWRRAGVQVHRLRGGLQGLGEALRTEKLPALDALQGVATAIGERVPVPDREVRDALDVALHGGAFRETTTELTAVAAGARETGDAGEGWDPVKGKQVRGVVNRDRLAREARAVLRGVGLDDRDSDEVLRILAGRIAAALDTMLGFRGAGGQPDEAERTRISRDVVHLLVRSKADALEAERSRAVAEFVQVEDAEPLPRAVLFPRSRVLMPSPRNIYGVFPPTEAEWAAAELGDPAVVALLRQSASHGHRLADGRRFTVAYLDGAWRLNDFERRVAEALDDAEWVLWWHRNPPRKPYSVSVVKATERGFFYPDFVVCVQPYPGARVRQRLLEPKESADDARQRMARDPLEYGRVFFLKMVNERIFIRDRSGRPYKEAGDDLEGLRELLQAGE